MPHAIETRIHRSSNADFPDLRDGWERCIQACPPEQRLFTYDWYRAWVGAHTATPPWTGRSIVIEATDQTGAACGYLPLAERCQQGMTILSLAGFYQPLRTFPCMPDLSDAVATAMTDALAGPDMNWDVLRLGPTDTASPERAALVAALQKRFPRQVQVPHGRTIVTHLLDSIEAYNRQKSVKRIRSYERRFLREPNAAIEHIRNPSGAQAESLVKELGDIESHSWLATQGGDLRFAKPCDQAFWCDLCNTTLSPRRQLDVWIARLGATPVAFRVVLSAGGASYMIANQYAESADTFRLGWILYLRNIESALETDIRFIDAAPGDIHYKGRLGGEETDARFDLCVMPNSARGALIAAAFHALHVVRNRLDRHTWTRPLAARLPRV